MTRAEVAALCKAAKELADAADAVMEQLSLTDLNRTEHGERMSRALYDVREALAKRQRGKR